MADGGRGMGGRGERGGWEDAVGGGRRWRRFAVERAVLLRLRQVVRKPGVARAVRRVRWLCDVLLR